MIGDNTVLRTLEVFLDARILTEEQVARALDSELSLLNAMPQRADGWSEQFGRLIDEARRRDRRRALSPETEPPTQRPTQRPPRRRWWRR